MEMGSGGGRGDNSRPTSTGSPCNKTMSMSVSFRSGQTTETASLVSSSAAVTADNNGTGSTTSPVDLTAKGLGLCPGQARNRGHSVCLEDEFAAGFLPHGPAQHQLHYTTLPRNSHTNGRAMRLPIENGGGHDKMLATIARTNIGGGLPNGMKPHLPPRPPLRTSEVTYAELTLPRHGGGGSHPLQQQQGRAHPHLKPASDSPPASTSTFKSITSPPPRGSHPLVTSPTSAGEAPGPMYATLGTRGTTATSPPGLIGTLPEEDETAEEHAAAAAPVPPMFADPPRKHNMTGKALPLTSCEETNGIEFGAGVSTADVSDLTRF